MSIEKKLNAILAASVLTLNGCGTDTSKNKVEQSTTKTEVVKNAEQKSAVDVDFENKKVTIEKKEKKKTLDSLIGKKYENFDTFFKELVPIVRDEWKENAAEVYINETKVFLTINIIGENIAQIQYHYHRMFKDGTKREWEEELYIPKEPDYRGIKKSVMETLYTSKEASPIHHNPFKDVMFDQETIKSFVDQSEALYEKTYNYPFQTNSPGYKKAMNEYLEYKIPNSFFKWNETSSGKWVWCDPKQDKVLVLPLIKSFWNKKQPFKNKYLWQVLGYKVSEERGFDKSEYFKWYFPVMDVKPTGYIPGQMYKGKIIDIHGLEWQKGWFKKEKHDSEYE